MSVSAVALPARVSLLSRLGAYVALTKPRIIELLLITTLPTMILAKGGLPRVWLMIATLVGGALAAGGANAINMYVDRDIDKLMHRTAKRPLVTGAIAPRNALIFAVALEIVAFVELWVWVNLLSAVLAMPVLVGWAAVTDSLAWAPVVLFAVIFMWTPPHFWALAFKYKDDYEAANVPMMPVVATFRRTSVEIMAYTLVMVGLTLLLAPVAHLGLLYVVSAAVLGAGFIAMAARMWVQATPKASMQLFSYSITYLTLLFIIMAVDVFITH